MGESADRQWAVMRQLHEQWSVPLTMLAECTGRGAAMVERRAAHERWVPRNAVLSLQGVMIDMFNRYLNRFSQEMPAVVSDEKTARSLSTLAKALETIAATAVKVSALEGRIQDEGDEHSRGLLPDADVHNSAVSGTADLDRKLAELVENLAR